MFGPRYGEPLSWKEKGPLCWGEQREPATGLSPECDVPGADAEEAAGGQPAGSDTERSGKGLSVQEQTDTRHPLIKQILLSVLRPKAGSHNNWM